MVTESLGKSSDPPNSFIFGDFRLLRELGKGGGGVVWEAEEIALGRRVALKVFPYQGEDSDTFPALLREATAGGRLTHSSIVQIFSMGVVEGKPYLAQELVEGGDLASWIASMRQGIHLQEKYYTTCAEMIASVADGLAEAHQAGVVHCDIKPANILLTPEAVPKVADFGLAMIGNQFPKDLKPGVGSPYTMSPEQVAMESLDLGPLTDVFSLGATLYEMLTLQRAFDGDTLQQVVEKILLQDPTPPCQVHSRVPADLSAICMRALEKRPMDRYASMRDFADDLENFLQGDTVQAKPPSSWGVLQRWARRHPVPAASLFMGIGASIFVGLMAIENLASRKAMEKAEDGALTAQQTAKVESASAVDALGFLQGIFAEADSDDPARDLLAKGELVIATELGEQPAMQARLLKTIGRVYLSVGDYSSAQPILAQSASLNASTFGAKSLRAIESYIEQARLAILQGNYHQAERTLISAEAGLAEDSDLVLELQSLLAHVRWRLERSGQAKTMAQVLQRQRVRFGELDERTLDTQNSLFAIYFEEQRFAEAEPLVLLEYQARSRRDSPFHPEALTSLHDLASVFTAQGRYQEAESRFLEVLQGRRQILPAGHPDTMSTLGNLAVLYSRMNRLEEAESFSRQVYETRLQVLPKGHPNTLVAAGNLANVLRKQGSLAEAEKIYHFALTGFRERGEEAGTTSQALRGGYIRLLMAQERWDEAESQALDLLNQTPASSTRLERHQFLLKTVRKSRP